VVQANTHLAILAALVAEGVLDAHLGARSGIYEDVIAHRMRNCTVQLDLVVTERDRLPATAAVDRKASILALELIIFHRLRTNKVRHRLLAGRAEGVSGRFGGLEENAAVAIAVQFASRLTGSRDVVTAIQIDL